jgi:hypothetical protein
MAHSPSQLVLKIQKEKMLNQWNDGIQESGSETPIPAKSIIPAFH